MSSEATQERPSPRAARLGLAAFILITAGGVFSPAAKLLIALVPLFSFGLGLYLHRHFRGYYVALVCWLFFLISLVRRLIEFRTGSPTASFVMISPFLACLAGLYIFHNEWTGIFASRLRTWTYVAIAVFYGAVVGLLSNPLSAVVQDIFGWTSPMCFGLYLYAQREHAGELLASLRSSFLYGTLVMGVYGLYQFFFLAPWDALWMENSGLTSIGSPEPLQVRVFSTMNTPQPLADFLIAGVLLSMTARRRIRFLAMPLGILVTGLTISRSSWICGAISLIYMTISFTPKQRLQLGGLLLVCFALLGVAYQVPEVSEMLRRRVESFTDLRGDYSVNDRLESQQQAISAFESSPFGLGLGVEGHNKSDGPTYGVPPQSIALGDNGLEEVLLSFGWCGSLIFFVGFGGAVAVSLRGSREQELLPLKALLVGMVFQIPVMGVFPGASGFLLWSAIGLSFAYAAVPPQSRSKAPMPASPDWSSGLVHEA